MKFNASLFSIFLVLLTLALLAPGNARAENSPPSDKQKLHETLKNAPAQTPKSDPDPYMDLPDQYIQEAQRYYALCERTGTMRMYYDCKCLASTFLDKRIEMGPDTSDRAVAMAIAGKCADATKAAGYEYEECVKQGAVMPLNIPVEEYCACYANTFAKLYEKYNYNGPSARTFTHFQSQAYVTCNDPEAAKKLFPGQKSK